MKPAEFDTPRRLLVTLAYDGTNFHGWQYQKDLRTVQGTLEKVLSDMAGFPVTVTGAGRTDAGVHATGQTAHFDFPLRMSPEQVKTALNSILDPDIRINAVRDVPSQFSARFDACARKYRYRLAREQTPFNARYTGWLPRRRIDTNAITACIPQFLGTHDFTAFSQWNPDVPNTVCTVSLLEFHTEPDAHVWTIQADRFLHNMVRRIVGCMINIGHKNLAPSLISQLIRERNRHPQLIPTAPPNGLYLVEVSYPDEVWDPGYVRVKRERPGQDD